ncbi:MAG: ATP-dependent DNA helicase, partial [Planctomycetota bacterium]
MHRLLEQLDEQQRAAVTHADGPLIVLAGPGSGKTRVITHRVGWLVDRSARDEHGAPGAEPESVLAVTFTVKAAEALRARLADVLGTSGPAERVRATNFHRFGLGLVQRFADVLGLPREPVIIDSAQRRRLLRDLSREHGLLSWAAATGRDAAVDGAVRFIEAMAHEGLDPRSARARVAELAEAADRGERESEERETDKGDPGDNDRAAARERLTRAEEWSRLYGLFADRCRERGWITLDDLIRLPTELLRDHPGAASIVRSETRHVVVDEFQDVNRAQIELLRLLSPPASEPDLCVVGDDDQSIYEFRGADDRAFERFAGAWPGHTVRRLETNYRSASRVVAVTQRIIGRAETRFDPDKRMTAHRRDAGEVECVGLTAEGDDAEAIAAWIRLDRARSPDREWSSYAVIAPSHGDLDRIGAGLRLERIPAWRSRREAPTDDPAVQDLLAWIELVSEPQATWAARRLLSRPPYDASLADLAIWERAYRSACSRFEEGAPDASDPGTFASWLATRVERGSGAAMFLGDLDRVRAIAAQHGAGEAVHRVVLETGLALADLAGDRAGRLAAVVAAMNWARDAEPRLEPPRDLAALWRHYRDLDASDRAMRDGMQARVHGGAADSEDEEREGVRLLTAHASKGLEFPVVLVPRAQPRHGYGTVRAGDELDLPEGLLDRAGDDRPRRDRLQAERRRLFFVACTRAEDTLVVMAKRNKSPSKSVHFFEEIERDALTSDVVSSDVVSRRDGDAVVKAASEAGVLTRSMDARLDPAQVDEALGVLSSARASARLAAAEALDVCERAEDVELVERAAEAASAEARRLAIASTIARTGAAPAWTKPAEAAYAEDLVARWAEAGATRATHATRRALRLSFTRITTYRRCPACYYLQHELGLSLGPSRQADTGTVAHDALR